VLIVDEPDSLVELNRVPERLLAGTPDALTHRHGRALENFQGFCTR
jgi:hypothetical protein